MALVAILTDVEVMADAARLVAAAVVGLATEVASLSSHQQALERPARMGTNKQNKQT